MRRSFTACRTGVSLAAAVLLLTACGGSDDESSSASGGSSSSAPESTASESGGDNADSEFCTAAAAVQERVGSTVNDPSQQANLPQVLQETATEIRAIEAPSEIADDWNALADGADQLSAVIGSVDPADPNALATIEERLGEVTSRLTSASVNVETYLREECGIGPEATEPASPSS